MILRACVFEVVTKQVEQVPVPDWVFQALGGFAQIPHHENTKCRNHEKDILRMRKKPGKLTVQYQYRQGAVCSPVYGAFRAAV
jgi:hypothetical protein